MESGLDQVMTTADIYDNSGHLIKDEQGNLANPYMTGAGHINVSRAMDPGLVYEINDRQYASHICSTLGDGALRAMRPDWRCSDLGAVVHPSQLNYPSFTLPLQPGGFSVWRALTNVNVSPPGTSETYTLRVVMAHPQVHLTVDRSRITFRYTGDVVWFEVSVSRNSDFDANPGTVYPGIIEWSSSKHTVRSRVLVVDGLITSLPPTPWKLD